MFIYQRLILTKHAKLSGKHGKTYRNPLLNHRKFIPKCQSWGIYWAVDSSTSQKKAEHLIAFAMTPGETQHHLCHLCQLGSQKKRIHFENFWDTFITFRWGSAGHAGLPRSHVPRDHGTWDHGDTRKWMNMWYLTMYIYIYICIYIIIYMTMYIWHGDTIGILIHQLVVSSTSPKTWPEPSTVSLVPARGLRWIGPWTSGPREDSWAGGALDWLSRHFSMITCYKRIKRVVVSKLTQKHWKTLVNLLRLIITWCRSQSSHLPDERIHQSWILGCPNTKIG